MEVYALKVTLLDTSPPVWRRILVPRDITLDNLHRTLQAVTGWTNSHLHHFVCLSPRLLDPRAGVGSKITNEKRTRLGEVIGTVGVTLWYEYDFGLAGGTRFFLKKSCLETKRFSRYAWQANEVVRPKTVEGRKDLRSFCK